MDQGMLTCFDMLPVVGSRDTSRGPWRWAPPSRPWERGMCGVGSGVAPVPKACPTSWLSSTDTSS